MRVFFPPFFGFCFVLGGGGEFGFLSPLNTFGHGYAVLSGRGTSSSHKHHLQLYGRDGGIGVCKAQ